MLLAKTLERQLGLPLGQTLTALVRLASKESKDAPWSAFAPLWLHLPWLKRGVSAAASSEGELGVPNVHAFAETGGDLGWFGFLLDDDLPTDERPIVVVRPKEDAECIEVVAPNLRGFLSLVATAFGEVVSRQLSDTEWLRVRGEWYGDDPARLAEMSRLASLLRSIPGVEPLESPSRMAQASPNRDFAFVEMRPSPEERTGQVLTGDALVVRDRILALSSGMVDGRCL